MNDEQIQVLLVEDNPGDARLIREMLTEEKKQQFEIEWVDRLSKASEYASTADVDIVLSDLSLPDSEGLETFTALYAQLPTVPIIVLSGMTDETLAIQAVQDGAQDYLVKGQVDSNLLARAINYAIERKKTEKKLQEAMEIKSQFTSMVSHELRTPLTAIKEGIALVCRRAVGTLNDDQQELLDIAKRNVDRLARLINDVLDFQKLEAGKMEFNVQENDINEVVREVEETMAPLVNEKGLNLVTQLEETVPGVKFDRDKITQVLTNLVNNAIKFTEKGDITISTSRGENIIQVSVSDTGWGIKKEDLPKVFCEFEQLPNGDKAKAAGTGLGLAISKEIIEQHRGKICAESEPDKGTSFYFVLPVKERRSKRRK